VSAFILIAGITQLNLGLGLMRWLPAAGCHAPPLVWRSLLLIMPLAGLVGLGYVLAVPELARTAAGVDGSHGVGVCLFALAAAGWGAFVVHDYILVAIGKPWWCVWRNGLFAVVRIALLVVLGTTLGAQGVVLSWVGPIVVWIALGSLVLVVAVRRFARQADGGTIPSRSEVARFLGPTAAAQIGYTLLLNQVPLLVILRYGPESGAAFFIAWQAVTVVEVVAIYFVNGLSSEVARAPERATVLARTTRRRLLLLFLPPLALGVLVAAPMLGIFGEGYSASAPALRVLLVGLAFRLVVVHALGVRQALGQAMRFARLQIVTTGLVLLAVLVVPARLDGDVESILLLVACAYLAVQFRSAVAVLCLDSPARRARTTSR
jgi:O-antigen/teichoic acid export membrane protein